jgi:hypothetical protein
MKFPDKFFAIKSQNMLTQKILGHQKKLTKTTTAPVCSWKRLEDS